MGDMNFFKKICFNPYAKPVEPTATFLLIVDKLNLPISKKKLISKKTPQFKNL